MKKKKMIRALVGMTLLSSVGSGLLADTVVIEATSNALNLDSLVPRAVASSGSTLDTRNGDTRIATIGRFRSTPNQGFMLILR